MKKALMIVGLMISCLLFAWGTPATAGNCNDGSCYQFVNYPDTDFLVLSDIKGKSEKNEVVGYYQFMAFNQFAGVNVCVRAPLSGTLIKNGLAWLDSNPSSQTRPVMSLVGNVYAEFWNSQFFYEINLQIIFDDNRMESGKVYGIVDVPGYGQLSGEPIAKVKCRNVPSCESSPLP
jgi:hypothetical protein